MTTHAENHASPPDAEGDHGHQGGSAHGHHHHPMYHVSSVSSMVAVWLALMALTGLTVFVADYGHLGQFDIVVAMLIATVKAVLVGLYFMHLLYDRAFNGFVLVCSVLFVALFLGVTVLDSIQYQPEIEALATDTTPP